MVDNVLRRQEDPVADGGRRRGDEFDGRPPGYRAGPLHVEHRLVHVSPGGTGRIGSVHEHDGIFRGQAELAAEASDGG